MSGDSNPTSSSRPFKIWNWNRRLKKAIVVKSFQELLQKGREKLQLPADKVMKVVLEEDGTEVDDEDYFAFVPNNSTLMFLVEDQSWTLPGSGNSGFDEVDTSVVTDEDERNLAILHTLKDDLSKIVTFSSKELELLVDSNPGTLSHMLGIPETGVRSILEACQNHLDDQQQTREAVNLLRLYHHSHMAAAQAGESKKRKQEQM